MDESIEQGRESTVTDETATSGAPEQDAGDAQSPAPTTASVEEEHRRMRWASRRGMLELDLILEPFVREAYTELADDDRRLYRELMLCQDQELFAWFLKREEPENPELAGIVRKILSHKRDQART